MPSGDRVPERQLALLLALAQHGVEFVVLGGVAAQLHGWHGTTVDLDIAVSRDEANFGRLDAALGSVDAKMGTPGAFGTPFRTPHGRIEIVGHAHAVGDYAAWARRAAPSEIAPGVTVMVADAVDVVRSKAAAGRAKDRDVLPQMRRDLIDSGALDPADAGEPIAPPQRS